jgi:hypothetical protein
MLTDPDDFRYNIIQGEALHVLLALETKKEAELPANKKQKQDFLLNWLNKLKVSAILHKRTDVLQSL